LGFALLSPTYVVLFVFSAGYALGLLGFALFSATYVPCLYLALACAWVLGFALLSPTYVNESLSVHGKFGSLFY
ncbi:MAG: hypothetical protein OQL27_07875, partial [Sedimenticola sp.]|nr:hypothetical protein [Sedimenticola sp.]